MSHHPIASCLNFYSSFLTHHLVPVLISLVAIVLSLGLKILTVSMDPSLPHPQPPLDLFLSSPLLPVSQQVQLTLLSVFRSLSQAHLLPCVLRQSLQAFIVSPAGHPCSSFLQWFCSLLTSYAPVHPLSATRMSSLKFLWILISYNIKSDPFFNSQLVWSLP